jgi:hypothetical protein
MVIKNHNVEQKAISIIADIFNTWCSEDSFPYNVDTSDLRWNDKGQYYDGQIVIRHKLAEENKGLRFFIQSKGTTGNSYPFKQKKYKELLCDIKNHMMPTFLFIVYMDKSTLDANKIQFLFLNECEAANKFSLKHCSEIKNPQKKDEFKKAVEEIIGRSRRHYFDHLTSRFVGDIPREIQDEVENYNSLLDREFRSVKNIIYPHIWKISIFYEVTNGRHCFGRAPIPYGYSTSLIHRIPEDNNCWKGLDDNYFWHELCDTLIDYDPSYHKEKISFWLLQKDLELCIKNKRFDLSCLKNVPEFGRIHAMNIEVEGDYSKKIFLYLEKHFEEVYDKFCQENFPLLKSDLKLNSCNILCPEVCKPVVPGGIGWDSDCWIISKEYKESDEHILVSNEYDSIKTDWNALKEAFVNYSSKSVRLRCSENILKDSIYQTLTHKLKKLGYLPSSFSLNSDSGVEFE